VMHMECDNFAEIACELAHDGLMESSVRANALEHARSCRNCEMKLAAERALNQALGFAAEAEVEGAPPSVKVALENAFAELPASPMTSRHADEIAMIRAARTHRFLQAAAAALLILFAAAAFYVMRLRGTGARGSGHGSPDGVSGPSRTLELRAPGTPESPRAPGSTTPTEPLVLGLPPHPGRRAPSLKLRLASNQAGGAIENAGNSKTDSEAMTDFIPLTYLTRSTAIESGQVMRVRVPVSTFIALGVPINNQHADELVNAELVVGDDGVMRAVRLLK
jgi:hypothetical protein